MPLVEVLEMNNGYITNYNYLVIDPNSRFAVIVDPAWHMDLIEQALVAHRVDLKGVLITHTHFDHIHLAAKVAQQYDCPIWISREEIIASKFSDPHLVEISTPSWQVGGLEIEALATPGHTAGCICYRIGQYLFTGDTLFNEGCGFCPDVASAYQLFDSLQYLKAQLSAKTIVYPGHCYGKPVGLTFEQVMESNLYLHFKTKQQFAQFLLRQRKSGNIN